MRRSQQGVSVFSVLVLMALIGFGLLLFFKVVPVYSEYFAVKKALNELALESHPDGEYGIRKSFQSRAYVADVKSIRAENLVIVAAPGFTSIDVAWRREVPLVANVSLVFDFAAHGGPTQGSQIKTE